MPMEEATRKPPALVWVISIFTILSVLFGMLSIYLVASGTFRLPEQTASHLTELSAFDYGLAVVLAAAQLYAAIAFIRLKKIAFYLFAATFVINLASSAWQGIDAAIPAEAGSAPLVGMFVGWAISLAICIYAGWLAKRGVLT